MERENKANSLQVDKYLLIDNLRFCLKSTIECYPRLLVWCLLVVIVNTVIPVISTFLPKIVIEKLTLGDSLKSTITVTVTLTLSVAILSGMKRFFEKYVYHHKFKMNTYYMQKVAIKGMTTDYCNQETDRFRKLHTESSQSCNNNYSALTQVYDVTIAFCSNALGFLLFFGILTQLNVVIIVFLVSTTLVSYYLNSKINKWAEVNQAEKISYQQRTAYITGVSSDLKSAKDIRLYHMIEWLGQIYQKNIDDLGGWYKSYTQKVFGVAVCDSGMSMLRDMASYTYLLYLVMSANIDVSDFVLYFGVITGFSGWLGGMLGQITALKRINMSINTLRTFLNYPDSYKQDGGVNTTEIMAYPSAIELRDVSYRYEGSDNNALSHINLKIAPKEHVAIVGLNGAGKTTLVKLICGLIDPSEGTVFYNNVNVKDYNRNSYYQLFSAVFQQFSILPVTFAEIVAETGKPQIDRQKVDTVKENKVFETWSKKTVWFNRAFMFYGQELSMSPERAKDVRIYEQSFPAISAFHNLQNKDKADSGYVYQMSVYSALANVVVGLSNVLSWVYVAVKAYMGAYGVGNIVQYIGALSKLSAGIQEMMFIFADNEVYCSHLQSLFDYLDIPNHKYNGTLPVEKRAFCEQGDMDYEIEFHNVSFRYPGAENYAIRNVSMKIRVGQKLAIVGMNGSGKSTFIKLLCRLYDPTEGEIRLNGIDIRKYNYDEYLSIFSVVFQDFKLFSFSLGQNVATAVTYDRAKAERSLVEAGFGERLTKMPKGLDTALYKDFDTEGVEISGGEAQKIALARALYKDSPFIILDEPTAALDPIAEAEIYTKFNEIVGDKTAIYISHRLSSCKFCDEIVVFHGGTVIQQGTHEELVSDETGKYFELWYAQAQYYTI